MPSEPCEHCFCETTAGMLARCCKCGATRSLRRLLTDLGHRNRRAFLARLAASAERGPLSAFNRALDPERQAR